MCDLAIALRNIIAAEASGGLQALGLHGHAVTKQQVTLLIVYIWCKARLHGHALFAIV